MRKFLVAVAALMFLGGAACGGGSKKATPTTAAGGGAPAATVKAEGTTWAPKETNVKVGDVVEWDVDGSIVHDLNGDDGVAHKAGSKFTQRHTYDKAGTYAFQCTIHAGMNGTVVVSP
ncbi:MAG: Copper binding protein plastocyanin/azurin family [Actinomycetota bacterium]|jgi:plastocyanin